MASWRHLSRIIAMQSFFEYEARGGDLGEILKYNINEFGQKISDPAYVTHLIEKMQSGYPKIRKLIKKHAPEWPVEKMDPVERSILTLGICELISPEQDVPVNVAINEAIEIAKLYGDENSAKFINGVMNAVAHDTDLKK